MAPGALPDCPLPVLTHSLNTQSLKSYHILFLDTGDTAVTKQTETPISWNQVLAEERGDHQ